MDSQWYFTIERPNGHSIIRVDIANFEEAVMKLYRHLSKEHWMSAVTLDDFIDELCNEPGEFRTPSGVLIQAVHPDSFDSI